MPVEKIVVRHQQDVTGLLGLAVVEEGAEIVALAVVHKLLDVHHFVRDFLLDFRIHTFVLSQSPLTLKYLHVLPSTWPILFLHSSSFMCPSRCFS